MEERKVPITRKGYEEKRAIYNKLIEVDRPQVIEELQAARAQGDLSENAEYAAAREKQAEIESQIADLEHTLSNCEIIEHISSEKVNFGCSVYVYDTEDEEDYTYHIVGPKEVNTKQGKISNECPLGAALLGKQPGDEVIVAAGDGHSYKVIIRKIEVNENL